MLRLPLSLVLTVAAARTAYAAPPRQPHVAVESYERWVTPEPLNREERLLFRLTRGWAAERGSPVRYDARLVKAARQLLFEVPAQAGDSIDLAHAQRAAQKLGWTDGQLAAVGLHVPASDDLSAALRAQLKSALGGLQVNRVGIAAKASAEGTVVLLLLSLRLVDLEPTPARVHRGTSLRLRGRVAGTLAVKGASLAVELPGGALQRRPLSLAGRAFTDAIGVGEKVGVIRLEVLVDFGRGPVIAAILPVGVDMDPSQDAPPSATTDPGIDLETDEQMESAIVALVLGSRAAAGAPLAATSAGLADLARAHATDMRDHGFFAHVSPTTGDVTSRLKQRGIHYVRALENIAIGDSLDAIWQQWMASPAHRANLLDPTATALGVGLVSATAPGGGLKVYAVLVLAKLADEGDSAVLARDALVQLNRERRRRGFAALAADPALARLALRHSQELAHLGRVDDATPAGGALVDIVFEQLEVSEAAADVFLADSVAVITTSAHLREPFGRVGVGVFRDSLRTGAQLYVTVIYASD